MAREVQRACSGVCSLPAVARLVWGRLQQHHHQHEHLSLIPPSQAVLLLLLPRSSVVASSDGQQSNAESNLRSADMLRALAASTGAKAVVVLFGEQARPETWPARHPRRAASKP